MGFELCFMSEEAFSRKFSHPCKEITADCKVSGGVITLSFDRVKRGQNKETTSSLQSGVVKNGAGTEEAVIGCPTSSTNCSCLHHMRWDPNLSWPDILSSPIANSGHIPYSGSFSIRSESSTTSARYFAVPILERATGLAFRFVIGRTKDAKKMADLKKEEEKYHEYMLIDVEEEYIKLPYKTLAFFKASFNLFDAEYYVKDDDDIYMRQDRLATHLAKDRPHCLTYIGCMIKGPFITDSKLKWYESSDHLIGNEYFLCAYGPIYGVSAEVVASLANARNNRG